MTRGRPPRRSVGVLIAAVAVVAAGCGTTVPVTTEATRAGDLGLPSAPARGGGDAASPGSVDVGGGTRGADRRVVPAAPVTTPGEGATTVPGAASAPGAPARGPITIGFVAAGNGQEGASQAGADAGNTVTFESVFDALVKHYNARGGLGGRQIRTVKHVIPVTQTDYEQALSAGCESMTRDNKVDLLVSGLGFYSRSFLTCVAKARLPHVEIGAAPTDFTDLAALPTYVSVSEPEVTTRFDAVFRGARASGLLPSGTKVGVVLEDCDYQVRAYDRAVPRLTRSYGVTVILYRVSCITGFGDAGALTAALQNAALRFRTEGVTRVFFGTTGEAVFHLLFDKPAESQGFSPVYLSSSLMQAAAGTSANFTPARLKLIHGWGYSPDNDAAARRTEPSAVTCLNAARAQGLSPASKTDDWYVSLVCAGLSLIDRVVTKTRGHVDAASFLGGLESLGSTWESPTTEGGTARFAPGRHYGPSSWREFSFSDACSCFVYGKVRGSFR